MTEIIENFKCNETKTDERITHVAILHSDGRIFSLPKPYKHQDLIKVMVESLGFETPIFYEQGFLTNTGRFLDRREALELALNVGQVTGTHVPYNLYCEDLW